MPYNNCKNVLISTRIEIDSVHNTIFLNGEHRVKRFLDSFYLYKFLKFKYFSKSYTNNFLAFNDPHNWPDPYERIFTELIDKPGKADYKPYCMCSTYAMAYNEEAMWTAYQHEINQNNEVDDKIVRFSIRFVDCLQAIVQYAEEHDNVSFYVSLIDYSLNQKDILKQKQLLSAQINSNCSISKEEHVQYLSIKRKAFAYENEIRITAIVDGKDSGEILKIGFPLSQKLFSVKMEPKKPQRGKKTTSSSLRKFYNNELLTELTKLGISTTQIMQSKLYSIS